jgi:hypothetical protein
VKFLTCLELHVDQLGALWKITWMAWLSHNLQPACWSRSRRRTISTCTRTINTGLKENQNTFWRRSQVMWWPSNQNVTTAEAKLWGTLAEFQTMHFTKCFKQRHCHWTACTNSSIVTGLLAQTAALSLDCLHKLSSRVNWREQHSLNVVVFIHSVQKPSDHCAHVSALQDDHRNVFCIHRLWSGNNSCMTK